MIDGDSMVADLARLMTRIRETDSRPFTVSKNLPEGWVFSVGVGLMVAPLTYWSLLHEGRYPFETQYCLGMAELRRYRRRKNIANSGIRPARRERSR